MKNLVMIVDDDPDIVSILKIFLRKKGYDTIESLSGEECLKKVDYVRPDIIVMDVMMPGIGGWDACKRLKENKSTSSIPVVILSVMGEKRDKKKSIEYAHADEHLTKPVDTKKLYETLGKFLSQ